MNTAIKDRVSMFHGGVLAYDEGLCKEDAELAAALWRNIYCDDFNENLASLVFYVRRELSKLDVLPANQLLQGQFKFSKPSGFK